jgi:hypothetical protein
MEVEVRCLTGIFFRVEVEPHFTGEMVKRLCESIVGAYAEEMKLMFNGSPISDIETLAERRVTSNSILHCALIHRRN